MTTVQEVRAMDRPWVVVAFDDDFGDRASVIGVGDGPDDAYRNAAHIEDAEHIALIRDRCENPNDAGMVAGPASAWLVERMIAFFRHETTSEPTPVFVDEADRYEAEDEE